MKPWRQFWERFFPPPLPKAPDDLVLLFHSKTSSKIPLHVLESRLKAENITYVLNGTGPYADALRIFVRAGDLERAHELLVD